MYEFIINIYSQISLNWTANAALFSAHRDATTAAAVLIGLHVTWR